jgi:lauroyl/myristoyl acyltransferase
VPTASIRRDHKQILDIGAPIDLQSVSIEEASRQVNDYFSNLARAYPDQWMGWQNLLVRWNLAN